jgi:methylene-tetrahydromethanopterin dehydrogenase
LRTRKDLALKGRKVAVFGATGVVGFAAAVIAALEGTDVTLVGYDGIKRVSDAAAEMKARFELDVRSADGSDDAKKAAILADTEIALCAGRAGVAILSRAQLAAALRLVIVADVNAVPPTGVEGLEMTANGAELTPNGVLGIGPLAIGNIKYKTEFGLFRKMIEADKPVRFDFRDAFALARELNA